MEALEENGRNVATNLQSHTEKSRKNINTRLPVLEDYGLVRKIGPAERSGLYEITPSGKAALIYQDQYDEVDEFDEFDALLDGPTPEPDQSSGAAETAFVRGDDDDSGPDDE